MLYLLSPAKKLDFETPVPASLPHSAPEFQARAAELIAVLRGQSPQQVAALMRLSDPLAALNVARYAAWRADAPAAATRQAVLAFNGDVYQGLQARDLSPAELDWVQGHVCILSGLYGVLRPLDLIQPHRLEMGTRLGTPRGSSLYQFWGEQIAESLNRRLAGHPEPVVVNLASQEYSKAVDRQVLRARVIDCVFEDYRLGRYRVVSFHAKRARGLMVRFAAQHRVTQPAGLLAFDLDGYGWAEQASQPDRLVFRRRSAEG